MNGVPAAIVPMLPHDPTAATTSAGAAEGVTVGVVMRAVTGPLFSTALALTPPLGARPETSITHASSTILAVAVVTVTDVAPGRAPRAYQSSVAWHVPATDRRFAETYVLLPPGALSTTALMLSVTLANVDMTTKKLPARD